MKTAKKIILWVGLSLIALIIIATTSIWLFKENIIRSFINEANKSLNTPVQIGKVDVSMWPHFPDLSIVFSDVYVEDSQPGKYPLLTAKTISFSLNPFDVYGGNYHVEGLYIIESEVSLKVDANGVNNYTITTSKESSEPKSITFDLKDIKLQKVFFRYHDAKSGAQIGLKSNELTTSLSLKDKLYDIRTEGDVTTEQIQSGENVFLKNKSFAIKGAFSYDDGNSKLIINSSDVRLGKSEFEIKGSYAFGEKELIDLAASGKNTDVGTLISLLPPSMSARLSDYRSSGNLYLNLALKGGLGVRESPSISVAFGCKDASFYHPAYKSKIEHATMEGSFASSSITNLADASLFLKHISGELNSKRFTADFSLENFENPYVGLEFKGDLDAASLLGFYPVEEIKKISGEITADISFKGLIALLKKKSTAQQVKTRGSIDMRDIELVAGKQNVRFHNISGSLQFNNNDLALSDVKGKFENSDFRLNGFFKNIITYLLFENQPIGIETDLRSDFLDVDQLLSIGFSEKGSGEFNFRISPNIHLNFNCDVRSLRYRKFKARDVRGDLLVRNQMAVSRMINFRAMGGSLSLNGIVDARNPKAIDIVSSGKLTGIQLDSLFYTFENFDQTFIEDKHLRGQANADISVEMSLNEKLNLYPETLVADLGLIIRNGELNKFEPMQKLNKFLDDEQLSRLRFADIKNDIHIEKKTIYIPQMEIRSNVTTIQVSGTHTFDQRIDYRVVAPINSRKKIDRDEAFGAIEEDNTGKSKVFLKIQGNTSKYTISYDKEAVKKKIRNDLKKEVLELKEAFKNKGTKKKKELELEQEEYFDWDAKP